MKTKSSKLVSAIAIGVICSSAASAQAGQAANPTPGIAAAAPDVGSITPQKAAQEDLGYDVFDGRTNKIARIHSVNPLWVYVIYEGEKGGRKIPRQDLNPQLKAKYPYDPKEAAEYRKRQAEIETEQAVIAAEQAAKQRAIARETLHKREQEVSAEIGALQKHDVELKQERERLMRLPPGHGRGLRVRQIDTERQGISDRISRLQTQLERMQAQRDSLP